MLTRGFVLLLGVVPAGFLASPVHAAEPAVAEPAAGWRMLFNGTDLEGWDGDPAIWSVKDGVIHGETTPEVVANGNTFLIAQDLVLEDFELVLAFRCSDTNNSGIQYRSRAHHRGHPQEPLGRRVATSTRLRNEKTLPNVSGFIYDEGGKRGRICLVGEQAEWTAEGKKVTGELIDAAAFEQLFRLDDWNNVRIVAEGNRIRHYLNETLILDFTDDDAHALRKGILALQLHAGKPMWVEFRDIKLRELPAE